CALEARLVVAWRRRRQDRVRRGRAAGRDPLPAVRMAAVAVQPLELPEPRWSRATVPRLRRSVEYVRDARTVSRLLAPVALDLVSALPRVVAARRLVRNYGAVSFGFAGTTLMASFSGGIAAVVFGVDPIALKASDRMSGFSRSATTSMRLPRGSA